MGFTAFSNEFCYVFFGVRCCCCCCLSERVCVFLFVSFGKWLFCCSSIYVENNISQSILLNNWSLSYAFITHTHTHCHTHPHKYISFIISRWNSRNEKPATYTFLCCCCCCLRFIRLFWLLNNTETPQREKCWRAHCSKITVQEVGWNFARERTERIELFTIQIISKQSSSSSNKQPYYTT